MSSQKIALIGSGTIGLSFAALHLTTSSTNTITIYDTRPDLETYIASHLPSYLPPDLATTYSSRLTISPTLDAAVHDATIIQEQGPENPEFKTSIWPRIEQHAPRTALFFSSTSGIPASQQSVQMKDRSRLVVVHPYNPPHVMPLLEVVPAPETGEAVVERTLAFWRGIGRTPVLVRKECTGFVANRLAFALFREACSLVANGVVSVEDADAIVQASMGPRWAVAGPFKAYHAGGGQDGLTSFMDKIGGTVQSCWDASDEDVNKANVRVGQAWQTDVCRQTDAAYGVVDTAERDTKTRKVLEAVHGKS